MEAIHDAPIERDDPVFSIPDEVLLTFLKTVNLRSHSIRWAESPLANVHLTIALKSLVRRTYDC